MNLIKTTLVALTVVIGFASNAQEAGNTSTRTPLKKDAKIAHKLTVAEFKMTPEQTANKRADELNAKVELNEEQFTKVKDLFLKVENRKNALNNSSSSEEEKNNALNDLQKMEDRELQSILTPDQKNILSTPKTNKTATNM